MSFIRAKKIKKHGNIYTYYYLVEGYRDKEGNVKQRVLKYYGREKPKGYESKRKKKKALTIDEQIRKLTTEMAHINKRTKDGREKYNGLKKKRESLKSKKELGTTKKKEQSISEYMKKQQQERTRQAFLTKEEKQKERLEFIRENYTKDEALDWVYFYNKLANDKRKKSSARREFEESAQEYAEAYNIKTGELWEYQKIKKKEHGKELEKSRKERKAKVEEIMKEARRKAKEELQREKELKIGIEIELEHTTDRKVAQQIALDHLNEYPDYYTRLVKMEKEAEKDDKDYKKYLEKLRISDIHQKYEEIEPVSKKEYIEHRDMYEKIFKTKGKKIKKEKDKFAYSKEKREKIENNTSKQIANFYEKYRGKKEYAQIKINTPQVRNWFETLKSSQLMEKRRKDEINFTSKDKQIGIYYARYEDRTFMIHKPQRSNYQVIEEIDY